MVVVHQYKAKTTMENQSFVVFEQRARVLNTILIVFTTSINIATFSTTLHSAAYGSVPEIATT